MRILIATALFCAIPTLACAQDDGTLPVSFAEVSLGASFIPTIRTKTYTLSDGIDTATGHIELNYSTGLTAGAEVGILSGLFPRIGFSISYDYLQARFDHGLITGTLDGVPGSLAFTRSDVASFGINLDNDVHLIAGNVFYNPWEQGRIHPYIGGGVGVAIISHTDTQAAVTATAGVRADLSDDFYVGVRYRYFYVTGPTDSLGIRYDSLSNHSVMAMIGVYLDREPSDPRSKPPTAEAPPPVPSTVIASGRPPPRANPPAPPPPPPPPAASNVTAATNTPPPPPPPPTASNVTTATNTPPPPAYRSDLGIGGSTVTQYSTAAAHMADPHGAFIAAVRNGGPAARAGLQPGDIVVSFDGQRVETFDGLTRTVANAAPGTTVQLGVLRNGHIFQLAVEL
jgi:opacity protein-like surface antigen